MSSWSKWFNSLHLIWLGIIHYSVNCVIFSEQAKYFYIFKAGSILTCLSMVSIQLRFTMSISQSTPTGLRATRSKAGTFLSVWGGMRFSTSPVITVIW